MRKSPDRPRRQKRPGKTLKPHPLNRDRAYRFTFEINRRSAGAKYLQAKGRPLTERRQFSVKCTWPEVAVFYWQRDEADDTRSTIERLPESTASKLFSQFASFDDIARNVWRPEYPDPGDHDMNEAGEDLVDRIVKNPVTLTGSDVVHAFIDLIETAWHGQDHMPRERARKALQRLIPRRPGGRKPLPPGLDLPNLRAITHHLATLVARCWRRELKKSVPLRQVSSGKGPELRQLLKGLGDPRLDRLNDADLVALVRRPSEFADSFVARTLGQSVRTLKTLAPLPRREHRPK